MPVSSRPSVSVERCRVRRDVVRQALEGRLFSRARGRNAGPRDGITALYYANPDWNEHWLGETIFYDEERQPVHAVGVKPGRLAIFHSNILHRAGVPSRECFEPRLSVAFTFVPR